MYTQPETIKSNYTLENCWTVILLFHLIHDPCIYARVFAVQAKHAHAENQTRSRTHAFTPAELQRAPSARPTHQSSKVRRSLGRPRAKPCSARHAWSRLRPRASGFSCLVRGRARGHFVVVFVRFRHVHILRTYGHQTRVIISSCMRSTQRQRAQDILCKLQEK